jgi:pyruvate formate lyase activating enzyme
MAGVCLVASYADLSKSKPVYSIIFNNWTHMEGIIFDIKRFAIHDGPGIRTTVFMKGCPLSCFWCHNPESRAGGLQVFKDIKTGNAVEIGKAVKVEAVIEELLKDRIYYEQSGGGVSFSGGEPFFQYDFLVELLKACKVHNLHTVLDTSGQTSRSRIRDILPFTDLFYFDIKFADPLKHKRFTGVDNKQILDNLRYLDSQRKNIEIRIPLLPGYNDSDTDLQAFCEVLSQLKIHPGIHLLPYHNTGSYKYQKYCLPKPNYSISPPETSKVFRAKEYFKENGFEILN